MGGEKATLYDGAADYLLRVSDLTGNAVGKTGILSVWLRIDGGDATIWAVIQNPTSYFVLYKEGAGANVNKFRFLGKNAAVQVIYSQHSATAYTASTNWLHVLGSWDLPASASNFYVNDVSDKGVLTIVDDDIKYPATSWGIAALTSGAYKANGALSELYFAPNQYLDFSVTANRRKFIDASGKPVPSLGFRGELPTGTPPIIYMRGDEVGYNRGTGGDFSAVGSPTVIDGPNPVSLGVPQGLHTIETGVIA